MNSTVRLGSVNAAMDTSCTVGYPEGVDLVDDHISVLKLFGTGLIRCEWANW